MCGLLFLSAPQTLAGTAAAPSKENTQKQSLLDRVLTRLGSSKQVDLSKGIDWGVLPGPFYNPDMGLGLGMAAIGLYKPANAEETTQLSTITIRGLISTEGAFGMNCDSATFFGDDTWRLVASASAMNIPAGYWGVGADMAKDDGNKEDYTKRESSLQPMLMRRVAPGIYVGFGVNVFNMHAAKLEPDGKIAQTHEGPNVFSSGATLHFSYDTRDFLPNPSRGQDFQAALTFFDTALGGDTTFQLLDWQYNFYKKITDDDILALDIHGRFTWGDITWNMLPQIGGPKRMRGYLQGQYRDKNLFETQLELRHHFTGRHGMVAWIGAGVMAGETTDLPNEDWLPNCGFGYRLEFKPRVNIRFDLGFGQDTTGFYFQVNEAF